jgi:hypothetical protein
MTKSQPEVKAELMQEAEAIIDELLAWQREHPESRLREIEELVQQLRKRLGEKLSGALFEQHAQRRPVPGPECAQCGQEMRYKGEKGLNIGLWVGDLRVFRGYYYCEQCSRGCFPLDVSLGLQDKHWSEKVVQETLWLSGREAYGQVVEELAELSTVQMSTSSAWRLAQRWGSEFGVQLAAEEAAFKAQAREWSTPGGPAVPHSRMGVAVDGAMMYIRGEGWKEFKVGCVFDVALATRRDPHTGDYESYGHAVNLSYSAHLGSPEPFGWQMWSEAQRRGWQQAQEGQFLGDGAPWIWNMHAEHFPYSLETVDWYHATGHLGTAKQVLYPEDDTLARRWYTAHETALYQGHAECVAHDLELAAQRQTDPDRADTLHTTADYFRTHQHRMQYQELRELGWPIGSGMVESAAKQFKARFAGPGMRWSRQGATHLLPVRAAVLSGKQRFDELWSKAYCNSPPN